MPYVEGLECMLRSAAPGVSLTLQLTADLTPDYARRVRDVLITLALPKLQNLRVHFVYCNDAHLPRVAFFFCEEAPRLVYLEIAVDGEPAPYDLVEDVDLFNGEAPLLRRVFLNGLLPPMNRVKAFDGVDFLVMYAPRAFASPPARPFLGGCSTLTTLHLIRTHVDSCANALANAALGARLACLENLVVNLQHDDDEDLRRLQLFSHPSTRFVCVHGDDGKPSGQSAFPLAVVSWVAQALPQESVELSIVREGATFYFIVIPLGLHAVSRAFAITSSALSHMRIGLLAMQLQSCDVLSRVAVITVGLGSLPELAAMAVAGDVFLTLCELSVRVDCVPPLVNTGRASLPARTVSSVVIVFAPPMNTAYNQASVRQAVLSWVDLPPGGFHVRFSTA